MCVRLESYESVKNQEMIRSLLGGAFANTAFCILAPDGTTRLSRSGRSPSALFGRRGGRAADPEQVVHALKTFSAEFATKGSLSEATIQDFGSTRQAINVASGDQRLLLLTVASPSERGKLTTTLKAALNDDSLMGRFHHDFVEKKGDASWADLIDGEKLLSGYFVIQADSFGMKGVVLADLPQSATSGELKSALKKANASFSKSEKRKVYGEHVTEGRRAGIYFENTIPYGEDRDGDGVIDQKRGRGRR